MFAIAGVKTLIHLGAFIAALKRCATQNPGFSASCEAVPFPVKPKGTSEFFVI
jgi:hypothetical protein